jgi:hypothetical protein
MGICIKSDEDRARICETLSGKYVDQVVTTAHGISGTTRNCICYIRKEI